MGIETERKFLVEGSAWRSADAEGVVLRQGYLVCDEKKAVRVRVAGSQAYLTIKGATTGITRSEFEYEIPVSDAEEMMGLCDDAIVEKTRYFVEHGGMAWVLDVFGGSDKGLVMAEIELESEDQPFELPPWAGEEVSGDPRYYNAYLSKHPFTTWGES
jgi:CYTH domain-containing protein